MNGVKSKWAERTGRTSEKKPYTQDQANSLDHAIHRPYSLLRDNQGSAPALSVNDGKDQYAFPYMTMLHMGLNQQGELVLMFSGGRVVVRGRQLHILYGDINRYKVTHIWVGGSDTAAPENNICIDAINIELNQSTQ